MRRPFSVAVAAALAFGGLAALAGPTSELRAQDAGGDAAAAPKPSDPVATPVPFKCTVTLAKGSALRGVVRTAGVWERRDEKGAWVAAKRDERGAGVRLWYAMGQPGAMFVDASRITGISVDGAFTDADEKAAAKAAEAAAARTIAERKQAADAKAAREAEEAAAAKKAAEAAAAAAKDAQAAAAAGKAPKATPTAEAAAAAKLLERFPPDRWGPETPDRLRQRFVILDIPPNTEEREFLDGFATWRKAYDAWTVENPEKALQAAKIREEAARPAPTRKSAK